MTRIANNAYYMLRDGVQEDTPGVCCKGIDKTYAVKVVDAQHTTYHAAVNYLYINPDGEPVVCRGYVAPSTLRQPTKHEKRRTRLRIREWVALTNAHAPKPRRAASKAKKRKRKGF
jgi:hypothetical protein